MYVCDWRIDVLLTLWWVYPYIKTPCSHIYCTAKYTLSVQKLGPD